jgi:predicted DNA-binding transcriptional regulator YafY
MTRKGIAVTLSLQERDKESLQKIALDLGITWGNKPNISKLIEAIARQEFLILPNNDWTDARIAALDTARKILLDNGKAEAAKIIAELLVSRSEIQIPVRSELQSFLAQPQPTWRTIIDRHIASQKPFELAYRDAADRAITFTVRYAVVEPIEKRQYLKCWCEESAGNEDLPPLNHNWTLRLDRIADAAITPLKGKWHEGLENIPVTLHLHNRLAFAYEPKLNDLENDWHPEQTKVKKVVRSVASTFWLFREVLPYGADCEIVSPPTVVAMFREKIDELNNLYKPTKSPETF